MARKNRSRTRSTGNSSINQPGASQPAERGQQTTGSRPSSSDGISLAKKVDNIYSEAKKAAESKGRELADKSPVPPEADVESLWQKADQAYKTFTELIEGLRQERIRLKIERDDSAVRTRDLESRDAALRSEQDELEKRRREVDEQTQRLRKDEADLERLRYGIEAREANAKLGFLEQEREVFDEIQKRTEEYIARSEAQLKALIDRSIKAKESIDREFDTKKKDREKQLDDYERERRHSVQSYVTEQRTNLDAERTKLDEKWNELREKQLTLQGLHSELEWTRTELGLDRRHLKEQLEAVEEKVQSLAAERIADLDKELSTARNTNALLLQQLHETRESLAHYEALKFRYGNRSPEEVVGTMDELRSENNRLQAELNARPEVNDFHRLEQLEEDKRQWSNDRAALTTSLNEYKVKYASLLPSVVEYETLRDQIVALESSRNTLRSVVDELRSDVDNRLGQQDRRVRFPACIKMDDDDELQEPVATRIVPDLRELSEQIQRTIAQDQKLYYWPKDIRSFLAGMNSSYLTILQGISGTGKTSLPLAIAKALGAGYQIVEVQAGWRDRQDLLGYYNSFEGKYHESKFTEALYRAQCPAYEDRPFLIVMDEMNLSYVEQYFADMLSIMELPDQDQRAITLMREPGGSDQQLPRLLINEGRDIRVPPNIRFIGTANQDETTKDFADKTYDRSHVMELPLQRPQADMAFGANPAPISFQALNTAFEKAIGSYGAGAKQSYEYLDTELRAALGNEFRIGWGHRLEQYVFRYVPVVCAAGGSIPEATDYILSMKILRKLRNRYDVDVTQLSNLKNRIERSWDNLGKGDRPSKSLALIDEEISRLGRQGSLEADL